jgi:hypothetical protein
MHWQWVCVKSNPVMGRGLQRGSELIGTQGAKVQRWFKKGEEVQRWFKGEEVQKCTGAQVQAQQRCWCTGAGTEKVVQRWCRAGAEEQRYGGAEEQRYGGAEMQRCTDTD